MMPDMKIGLRVAGLLMVMLGISGSPVQAQPAGVRRAMETITPGRMQQYIDFLASDALLGRNTPSPGLDTAAAYIARQFAKAGLKPLNGSYFQDLGYCYADLGSDNRLLISGRDGDHPFLLKTDFVPYEMTGSADVTAPVVFAGYGITAPEFGYDDYASVDAVGKIVLVLRQEPGQSDSAKTAFGGKELTLHSSLKEKLKNAILHGAKGMLVVSGPLNYISMKPRGYSWPSLSKSLPRDILPLIQCDSTMDGIPMVQVGEAVIRALSLPADTLKRIQQVIDSLMKPHSFQMEGITVNLATTLTRRPLGGSNVIGYLEGTDPRLKEQALVIGAHYDHVGYRKDPGDVADSIFNGADDNASGTAGVLAVANAFAAMKEKPGRSVLFMAFAGEEKGLLGSESYVKHPLWPLTQTIAMLNLDMISRTGADSLLIVGARQNPGLAKVIRKENRHIGMILTLTLSETMGGGSDHYSFYQKGIPALFFFAGMHEDYHQVSDNPDRTDPVKASRVARLVFLSAWKIANEKTL
jgi:hypothetical protein